MRVCHRSISSGLRIVQHSFTARCLSERVGEVEVDCSDVLQLTESDVQTNMTIIVVVILSMTGTENLTSFGFC